MKKNTNKILLMTLIVIVVLSSLIITILIQTLHHNHPEYFQNISKEEMMQSQLSGVSTAKTIYVTPTSIQSLSDSSDSDDEK